MLKLSKKQIEEIESLSELQFTPDEIATICDYHWAHESCFYARKKGNNNEWFGDRKHKIILRNEKVDFTKMKKEQLIQIINAIKDDSTVWEVKRDNVNTYVHPTQKPVDLALKAIINNTKSDGIVLDLFAGSGST